MTFARSKWRENEFSNMYKIYKKLWPQITSLEDPNADGTEYATLSASQRSDITDKWDHTYNIRSCRESKRTRRLGMFWAAQIRSYHYHM